MTRRGLLLLTMVCALASSGTAAAAGYPSDVFVNGRQLTTADVAVLQNRLGVVIASGYYLVNPQNGCWANLSNGTSGCLGSSGSSVSRYGSGEWRSDGSWSRYDNTNGFSVGGTGDGCLYAGDWSNC
ncbi:MAG: hypothetical protein FIA97_02485 [Methylococcaceae bacterium]|nr:hypothetical protein [Methylococcaceae bacterium]